MKFTLALISALSAIALAAPAPQNASTYTPLILHPASDLTYLPTYLPTYLLLSLPTGLPISLLSPSRCSSYPNNPIRPPRPHRKLLHT